MQCWKKNKLQLSAVWHRLWHVPMPFILVDVGLTLLTGNCDYDGERRYKTISVVSRLWRLGDSSWYYLFQITELPKLSPCKFALLGYVILEPTSHLRQKWGHDLLTAKVYTIRCPHSWYSVAACAIQVCLTFTIASWTLT